MLQRDELAGQGRGLPSRPEASWAACGPAVIIVGKSPSPWAMSAVRTATQAAVGVSRSRRRRARRASGGPRRSRPRCATGTSAPWPARRRRRRGRRRCSTRTLGGCRPQRSLAGGQAAGHRAVEPGRRRRRRDRPSPMVLERGVTLAVLGEPFERERPDRLEQPVRAGLQLAHDEALVDERCQHHVDLEAGQERLQRLRSARARSWTGRRRGGGGDAARVRRAAS